MASTLGTSTIQSLELRIPPAGDWRADVVLEAGEPPAPDAEVVLTVGGLVLQTVVIRSSKDAPDRPHVVLGGAPGWEGRVVRPLSYQSDAGVRLKTVLDDLARASGQEIEAPADAAIGEHYEVIASSPGDPVRYRDALEELADEGILQPWRVDPDGVTRFGARVGVEVKARATELRKGGGVGRVVYGIDTPAAFLPGNLIGGVPISTLVITETSGHLEAEVYTSEPNAAPSLRASVQRLVWRRLQEYQRTYLVGGAHADGRLDLIPPPDAAHLPEMNAVPIWTMGGGTVTPAPGAEVLVIFRDRQRRRPVVLAFAPGLPLKVELDADQEVLLGDGATQGVARRGDSVTVLLPPAMFTGTVGGAPASGMVVWVPSQTMGTITTFSAKVRAA